MADSKLFQVLSKLLDNDKKLKSIILSGDIAYNIKTDGTVDERLKALSGAIGTNEGNSLHSISGTSGNGLTIGAKSGNTQTITMAQAGADFGTIKSGGVATISDGQITGVSKADEAGKVTNAASIFGKTYDGSAAVTVTAGTHLSLSGDALNVDDSGKIDANDSKLVTGKTVYAATNKLSTDLTEVSRKAIESENILAGFASNGASTDVQTVSGAIAKAKEDLTGTNTAASGTILGVNKKLEEYKSKNDSAVSANTTKLAGITGTVSAAIDADVLAAKKEILGSESNGSPSAGETNKELRADINSNDTDITNLQNALSGYTSSKAVSSEFAKINAKLSGTGDTVSGDIATAKSDLSGAIGGSYTSGSTVHSAITGAVTRITKNEGILAGFPISNGQATVKGYVDEQINSVKIDDVKTATDWAKGWSLSGVNTTEGYAATYKLVNSQDSSKDYGVINIPKDQFLQDATYDNSKREIQLTFALPDDKGKGQAKTINIGVGDLVDTYEAGSGLVLSGKTFNIDFSGNYDDNKFLKIEADGIGLSGITKAFEAADTTLSGNLVGESSDAKTANTIYGAKKHADELNTTMDGRVTPLEEFKTKAEGLDSVDGSIANAKKAGTEAAADVVELNGNLSGAYKAEKIVLGNAGTGLKTSDKTIVETITAPAEAEVATTQAMADFMGVDANWNKESGTAGSLDNILNQINAFNGGITTDVVSNKVFLN